MTATISDVLIYNATGTIDLPEPYSEWVIFKVKGNSFRFQNTRTLAITKWVNFRKFSIRMAEAFEPLVTAMLVMSGEAEKAAESLREFTSAFDSASITEWADTEEPEPIPSGSAEGTLVVPDPEWDPEDFWPHATRVYTITNPKHGESYSLGGDLIKDRLDNYLALGKSDLLHLAHSQDIKTTTRMTKFDLAVALIRHVPSDPAY